MPNMPMDDCDKSWIRIRTHPERDALLKANRERDGEGLAQARLAWIARFGEGALLAWAAEHLSSWAVKELIKLGEPVNKSAILAALDQLDMYLAWGGVEASSPMETWDLFLPSVEASLELRQTTIGCLLRRNRPGLNKRSRLSWSALWMDRVFQNDLLEALQEAPLPLGGLGLNQGLGNEAPAPCYLTPLQIAWEQGRPDLCLSFLEHGLSAQTRYPGSLWPTWTLERAVLDSSNWVASLAGEAEVRAREALKEYEKADLDPRLELLAKVVRLDHSLPAPALRTPGHRF